MVRGQWFGSSVDSLACITSMCSVQHFPGGHSLCLASGSFFYPIPPPPQGFANFIDEWSHCDFCFTNFGVNFGVKYGKFGVSANPAPPPFIFPLINQCDRCLVPLAWGFMAGGHGFASHGDITLSRGWLCQKWKPLDILGTHLH